MGTDFDVLIIGAGLTGIGTACQLADAFPRKCLSGWLRYRGRDARRRTPPAQIPAGAIHAPGSHLGCLTTKRVSGHG